MPAIQEAIANGTRQRYLPPGFDKHPETVLEAVKVSLAVLKQEGVWCKGEWFQNPHPEVDPQNAFCNNWQACAQGIIASVTIGNRYTVYGGLPDNDEPFARWEFQDYASVKEAGTEVEAWSVLYQDTVQAVEKTLRVYAQRYPNRTWGIAVPSFNDSYGTTRDDIERLFQDTIDRLEGREVKVPLDDES